MNTSFFLYYLGLTFLLTTMLCILWRSLKNPQYKMIINYTLLFVLGFLLFDVRLNRWVSLHLQINNISYSIQMLVFAFGLYKLGDSSERYYTSLNQKRLSQFWVIAIAVLTIFLIYLLSQTEIQQWEYVAQDSLYFTSVVGFTTAFGFYTCSKLLFVYSRLFKYELSPIVRTRFAISLLSTSICCLMTLVSFFKIILLYTSGLTEQVQALTDLYSLLFCIVVLIWPFFLAPSWMLKPLSIQLDRFLKKRSIKQLSHARACLSIFGEPYTHIDNDDLDLMLQYNHNCVYDLVMLAGQKNDDKSQKVFEILKPIGAIEHPVKRLEFLKKHIDTAKLIISS